MFHVRLSQSLNLRFGVFTVLLFHVVLLDLIHPCRGQNRVIGPSQPIVAFVGEDIILPSVLDPPVNAFRMTVEWTRSDLDPRFVLVWRDGGELEDTKHPSYRGRTSVFTEELKHGNVSLKLSKVKISDEGRYRCFIPDFSIDSTVQLVVGAVSSPVVQMTENSSTVVLQCESKGWYPEPEVSWLDGEGHVLSAGPTETVRGPDGLYTVSSRVTVEKRHRNNFTCRVQQKDINQTRETQIHVPDHFFVAASTPSTPSTPSSSVSPGHLAAIFVGAALVLTVPFLVWIICRRKRLRNKRRGLEDGTEQTDKEKTFTSKGDETRVQVMEEGEGESVPLMARREEDNNLDNTGQEEIQSQSEHEEVAEREANQDQLVTKPEIKGDKDSAEGGVEINSINDEKAAVISTEGQTNQRQDMIGRQVKSDLDKGEEEQMMKPPKEDPGLSLVVVAEEQKEQLQNLHTNQEEKEEKETQQEQVTKDRSPKNNMGKKAKSKGKTAKKARKQEGATEEDLGFAGQNKQQRQRQRVENKGKLESELQKRNENDAIELESQNTDGPVPDLLEDQGQNENEIQKQQVNEKFRETEHKPPLLSKVSNRPQETAGRKTQELQEERQQGNNSQEHQEEAKEQPKQSTKEINVECQETREEKTDNGTDINEAKNTSVETHIQRQQQAEQQQEMREQPEECQTFPTEKGDECLEVLQKINAGPPRICESPKRNQGPVRAIHQETQKKGTVKEASVHDTQKTSKEMETQGQLQAVQQSDVMGESREQPENIFKAHAENRTECLKVLPKEVMKTDTRPDTDETQINVKKGKKQGNKRKILPCKQDKESHEYQQWKSRKRPRAEHSEQTQETVKIHHLEELNKDQVMDELQESDENSQMDVEPVCPEDQQMDCSLNPKEEEGKNNLQHPHFAYVDMNE